MTETAGSETVTSPNTTTTIVSAPITRLLQSGEDVLAVSGSKVLLINGKDSGIKTLWEHPQQGLWSSAASINADASLLAICDTQKQLYLYGKDEISGDLGKLMTNQPMKLAKTATSVQFTEYPTKDVLLVADKFGDVLRFSCVSGEESSEFAKWAKISNEDKRNLSIHTAKKRKVEDETEVTSSAAVVEEEDDDEEEEEAVNDAHHCTIIGHISMITDLNCLSSDVNVNGGFILTSDRDEKVRVTRSDRPEIIHSFALGHRQYVASIAVSSGVKDRFWSAGGDGFVAEWLVGGETVELGEKVTLKGENVNVQEVKVNERGDLMVVLLDKSREGEKELSAIQLFKKQNDGKWTCIEEVTAAVTAAVTDLVTAVNISNDQLTFATFTDGKTKIHSFGSVIEVTESMIEKVKAEELLESLFKGKLRKDVTKMDWNQNKHA